MLKDYNTKKIKPKTLKNLPSGEAEGVGDGSDIWVEGESDMEVAGVGDITVESTDDDIEVEAVVVSTSNLSMSRFSIQAGSKLMVKGAVARPSGGTLGAPCW